MTICIAALSDDGRSCVVAADRELTVGFPMNIAFEHHERKIEPLSPKCLVLSAGNALIAEAVVGRGQGAIAGPGDADFHRMATILRDTYMSVHMERAEQLILRPRGLTLQEFKDTGVQKIPLPIYQQIDQLFFNFTLNTEFLMAGVDNTGAHIGWVHYHGLQGGGWLESFDKLGYQAIGSGGSHAAILLSISGQHRSLSLAETVYTVHRAKVNAEIAPGVGDSTDMAVITQAGTEFLTEEFIERFGDLRLNLGGQQPPVADITALFDKRKES
jgi:hypothetical protein